MYSLRLVTVVVSSLSSVTQSLLLRALQSVSTVGCSSQVSTCVVENFTHYTQNRVVMWKMWKPYSVATLDEKRQDTSHFFSWKWTTSRIKGSFVLCFKRESKRQECEPFWFFFVTCLLSNWSFNADLKCKVCQKREQKREIKLENKAILTQNANGWKEFCSTWKVVNVYLSWLEENVMKCGSLLHAWHFSKEEYIRI